MYGTCITLPAHMYEFTYKQTNIKDPAGPQSEQGMDKEHCLSDTQTVTVKDEARE